MAQLPRPDAAVRLYCLPWAGAGAGAFRSWTRALPSRFETVTLALPGRERRFREELLWSITDIADRLTPHLVEDIDRPFVIYGHSMGALLGFEVACRLERQGIVPQRLVVSASRAPYQALRTRRLHTIPDSELLAAVREMQPDATVLDDTELAQLLLPILRADFTADETYVAQQSSRLSCPLDALGGTADPLVRLPDLVAWESCTTGDFRAVSVPGGHLFVITAAGQVQRFIAEAG